MTYFANITLQAKDETCDWRAFVACKDDEGNWWELRAYGSTPETAANDAWNRYKEPEWWHLHGEIVPAPAEDLK